LVANFVLLYSGGSMPQTEAEQAAVVKAWEAWYTGLGGAIVDAGNPFAPVTKHISSDGSVHNGPAGSMASGYSIVKAESLDAAVEMAKSCPVKLGGGQITVYETFPVM
jgi:hypothetical protein